MNERIKELADQAEACYIPRYDMWQMDTETLEKFVELIVRDCIEMVEPCKCGCCDGEPEGVIAVTIINQLKEHFGVDE